MLHLNVSLLKFFSSYGLMVSTTFKDKTFDFHKTGHCFPPLQSYISS
jgi:hypothetical protein